MAVDGTYLEKSLEDVNREIGDFLVPRIDMKRLSVDPNSPSPQRDDSRIRKKKNGQLLNRSIVGDQDILDQGQNLII